MRKDALVDYQRTYTLNNPNPNDTPILHDSSELHSQLKFEMLPKGEKKCNWWAVWKFSISGMETAENYFRYDAR